MQLIASGDQQAFNALYQRYKQRLFYYFYRMLNNSEEQANDFLQEVFMKIIENPAAFNPELKFSTWIFSVAGNMCKNEYRKREVREKYNEPLDIMTEINIQHYSTEEVIEKVFASLQNLGGEHQSVFLFRYREGFSIKEIAEIMDIAEGTVKSRLHYAKKHLASELNYLKDEIEL